MEYVLAFAFDDLGRVALIKKAKPEWQKGLLNGVGGKVEEGEITLHAMTREFYEETGVYVPEDKWHLRGRMIGADWIVHVFTVTDQNIRNVQTMESESVGLYMMNRIFDMSSMCIENVPALVELCRIPLSQPSNVVPIFELRYT